MTGYEIERIRGYPATTSGRVTRVFSREEVAATGKLRRYCDFVTRYLVRLSDGTELLVVAGEQERDDERWIRRLARRVQFSCPASRDLPWVEDWALVDEAAREEARHLLSSRPRAPKATASATIAATAVATIVADGTES